MKSYLILLIAFASFGLKAQDSHTYLCKKGNVHFFSSAAIENIDARSTDAMCLLNTDTKKVSAQMQQTSFTFKDKLMREHFNENYMESDKYPVSKLDMVIAENIDLTKDGTYDVTLKGTLEMHGVKKEREIKGKITVKGGQPVNATATFDVKLADHGIKIPKLVGQNIAESVKVDVDFTFEKYQK